MTRSYDPIKSLIKTVTKRNSLDKQIGHHHISKERLLELTGTWDSATGVRCKCGRHVMSAGSCSNCGVIAPRCKCNIIDSPVPEILKGGKDG